MKHSILLSSLIFLLLISSFAQQQQPLPDATLPLDPSVRTGKLANGFTYYIRANKQPEKRAQLYLVNKVGSILEDENQLGLAHFMEHLNFNGTKNFPKNELVNYLEKAGVKFGADLNAYTSFDETVYQLPIPTDDEQLFNKGMQIIRDWAQDALLETKEIDKERGVILEEKRMRKGVRDRLQQQILPVLLNNSRYAKRLPIGTEKVLTGFNPELLRRFHKDWYRPDLQALIVVGDINVEKVEAMIKKLFSDLKINADPRPRNQFFVPLTGKNQFLALTDDELTSTEIEVIFKHPALQLTTATTYREAVMRALFIYMLSARYHELQQKDQPYMSAQAGFSQFLGGLDVFSLRISAKPGMEEEAFKAAWREIERVNQHGFTVTEFEREKSNYIKRLEQALREKNKTPSISFVKVLQKHFLTGEAAPGIEYEYKLVQDLLKQITLNDIKKLAAKSILHINRDIILTAPAEEKDNLPDEKQVRSWLAEVNQESLQAYVDKVPEIPLFQKQLTPGTIRSESTINAVEVTELVLSNGIRVLLRPSNFKNEEILFSAISKGGTSLYEEEDYISASNASNLVASFGLGTHDPVRLKKLLGGKGVNVVPFINEHSEGISGSTSPGDLETALQLVHLCFTEPRKDSAIFRNIIERSRLILANRYNNPNNVFTDTINAVMGGYHYRSKMRGPEQLDEIELDKVYNIFRERFADADDFTFIFTGSFEVDKLKPLILKYLGSLPSLKSEESFRDPGIRAPEGKVEKTVYKGKENKASVQLVYHGEHTYGLKQNMMVNAIAGAVQFRLTERLREIEGAAYSPGVRSNVQKEPEGRFSLLISFNCAPENVDKLVKACAEEIEKLRKGGLKADDLQKFVAEQRRDYETGIHTNQFWMQVINSAVQHKEPLQSYLQFPTILEKLKLKELRKAAKHFLKAENVMKFVLLPENGNKE